MRCCGSMSGVVLRVRARVFVIILLYSSTVNIKQKLYDFYTSCGVADDIF
jgi:hypothetical protein